MGKNISAKLTNNNRITIPRRIRDYYELPDPDQEDVWIEIEIHGLDAKKHPDHEFAADHLLEDEHK
ncbi:hypothetical protein [Halonotius pteroides]|uniref:Uncharacterized protein n=1 Tax=Halonotius pteroides TaxID=268735 RepID=A0A3A6Q612_9EURY|nr:hypothetical protein [Halonotius pteroides]RJX47622.1 hypothetical protein DP106_14465 [Halonotius pteroides]RJX47627.1 hypothetical protein DP106_14495 [Halonotius pteroides]